MDEVKPWYFWLFDKPWKPLALGGICLLAAIAFEWHEGIGWKELAKHLIRDLGVAFVVAAVVAGGIELVAEIERKKAVDDEVTRIKSNVLAAVVDRDFPREWMDYVLKLLRRAKFLRREVKVDISLTRHGQATGKGGRPVVMMKTRSSYIVKNVTARRTKYDLRVFIETPWDDALRPLVQLKEIVVGDTPLTPEQIAAADKAWDEDANARRYLHLVPLDPGQEEKISVEYENPKADPDSCTFASIAPSQGLEMNVTAPQGMRVVVTPKHSARDDNPGLVKFAQNTNRTMFKITDPMFPYTVVEIAWSTASARAGKAARKT